MIKFRIEHTLKGKREAHQYSWWFSDTWWLLLCWLLSWLLQNTTVNTFVIWDPRGVGDFFKYELTTNMLSRVQGSAASTQRSQQFLIMRVPDLPSPLYLEHLPDHLHLYSFQNQDWWVFKYGTIGGSSPWSCVPSVLFSVLHSAPSKFKIDFSMVPCRK